MSVNNFNDPVEYQNASVPYILIKRLILLNPGTYQNRPNMGVGLFSRWKFSDTEDVSKLENEIKDQIETYLPQFSLNSIDISVKNDKELLINIQVADITYVYETNDGELTLSDL